MNKKSIFNIIKIILKPFVILYFWYSRWLADNKFKYELNSTYLGSPQVISYPFIYFQLVINKIYDIFIFEFGNYSLLKYKTFSREHYSEKGPGYGNLRNLSIEKKKEYYLKAVSRIKEFYNSNQLLLDFKNGDSFLDIACGYGRDIKFLSEKFDNSKIDGFDINLAALEIIKAGNQNPNVKVRQKSFVDFDFLNELKSNSYDWVFISHSLSTVFEDNYEKTLNLKRKLIKEFARVSNKGLIVLERPQEKKFRVELEQKTRCVIFHDNTEIFPSVNQGELYMMKAKESFAFFWKKKSN